MRITRVTDPVLACTIVTASELGGASLGRPQVSRTEERVTAVWRNIRAAGQGPATVQCRADTAASQITSVTVGGVERLRSPQPY